MQKKDEMKKARHPSEMTTDEALDYVFGPEIAEELKKQAGKGEIQLDCQPEDSEEESR
jgi:hypothetical protein